jgi:hypothetical protein
VEPPDRWSAHRVGGKASAPNASALVALRWRCVGQAWPPAHAPRPPAQFLPLRHRPVPPEGRSVLPGGKGCTTTLNRLRMVAWLGQRCADGHGRQVTSVTTSYKRSPSCSRRPLLLSGEFTGGMRCLEWPACTALDEVAKNASLRP